MATAVGNISGMPKSTERRSGEMNPTASPHGQPQTKPHSSAGMCIGQSMEPICGICPVKNGRTSAMARYSAE